MGKFIKYIIGGAVLAYALGGGFDDNIQDIFQPSYARPLINARETVNEFIQDKIGEMHSRYQQKGLERMLEGKK